MPLKRKRTYVKPSTSDNVLSNKWIIEISRLQNKFLKNRRVSLRKNIISNKISS